MHHLSPNTYHASRLIYHLSFIISHLASIIYHRAPIIQHLSSLFICISITITIIILWICLCFSRRCFACTSSGIPYHLGSRACYVVLGPGYFACVDRKGLHPFFPLLITFASYSLPHTKSHCALSQMQLSLIHI